MKSIVRWFTLVVVLVMLVSVTFGCQPKPTQESTPSEAKEGSPVRPKDIRAGSGPTGSVNHIVLSGMASLLEKDIPDYKVSVEITSGSQENIRLLQQGTADLGVATIDAALSAYEGSREFKDTPPKKINFVMGGIPTAMHFIVRENSPIGSIADLKGKKVGAGRGLMEQYYLPIVLEAYGLSVTDVKVQALVLGDMTAALASGTLDMICHCTPYPSTPIADLATTTPVRFLSIEPEIGKKVVDKYPYFFMRDIDAGTYKGQDKPVSTLSTVNLIVARADADAQAVYDWVKTVIEHEADLKAIHPLAGLFNKENAVKMALIPIHPGADKYYREIGLIK